MSRSSSSGFSPQGGKRFPVPSERGGVMVLEGEEAGRSRLTSVSGWHMGIPVSMRPAEGAQEARGPVRPGWTAGTGRQPCDGGGGSQTAKGPHTQGLFSASSRLLDDKRRCCVLRRLTTLSSACQVPGKQTSEHSLLSSAFTLAMSKSLLLSHSIPRNAHVLWPSSCVGDPSSSSRTSFPSASCSSARPIKLLSGDAADITSPSSEGALLAACGEGRASPSSSVPGAM